MAPKENKGGGKDQPAVAASSPIPSHALKNFKESKRAETLKKSEERMIKMRSVCILGAIKIEPQHNPRLYWSLYANAVEIRWNLDNKQESSAIIDFSIVDAVMVGLT
jgi:hypothetical protein